MSLFRLVSSAWSAVFGGGSSGKSVAETAVDAYDKFHPSPVTQHAMAVEDVKLGDESQAAARKYEPANSGLADWWNKFVDGLNRLPRPMFALWAFGELAGFLPSPDHLNNANPVVLNVIWTVIGFYFGIRTISQDLPKAVTAWYQIREQIAQRK